MSGSIAPLILEKLAVLFLLIGTGGVIRKAGLISEEGESVVSTLLVDLFWPALIFTSITMNLNREDILRNIGLPLFAAVTILTGGVLGLIAVKMMKYRGVRRNSFLFQSMMNNFVFLVLPFAVLFLPERGAGLRLGITWGQSCFSGFSAFRFCRAKIVTGRRSCSRVSSKTRESYPP